MVAFAANSLLCRMALGRGLIDPLSFTTVRLLSGTLVLVSLRYLSGVRRVSASQGSEGSWRSALALFGYAATFSMAYVSLETGTGALILFGAVQATMIGAGLRSGERLRAAQLAGIRPGSRRFGLPDSAGSHGSRSSRRATDAGSRCRMGSLFPVWQKSPGSGPRHHDKLRPSTPAGPSRQCRRVLLHYGRLDGPTVGHGVGRSCIRSRVRRLVPGATGPHAHPRSRRTTPGARARLVWRSRVSRRARLAQVGRGERSDLGRRSNGRGIPAPASFSYLLSPHA